MKYTATLKADGLLKGLTKLRQSYPVAANGIVLELAGEAQRLIKNVYAPVISGDLRSTVRVETEGVGTELKVFVRAGGIKGSGNAGKFVDYAKWVNDGTSKITPRFYMERGTIAAVNSKQSLAKRALESWLLKLNA